MRALMLTPDEGYLDRRIAQEAASLVARGWHVDIHAAVDPALAYSGDLAPGVRLLSIPRAQRKVGKAKRILRGLRRRLAPVIPPVDRIVETVRYRIGDRARAIGDANAIRLVAGEPYDLVVAHDVPVFPLGARLAAEWETPLICDLHEIFPEQDEHFTTATARSYWRSVEAAGIAAANGIICVNAAVADYVRSRYAPRATTVVIHNSMPYLERSDLGGRTVRDYYPIPADRRVMLFAGSLRPHANLETLVAGFDQARPDGWVLALLGDGSLRAELERMVERRRLVGSVFLGHRASERELAQVISTVDIGLLPYQPVGMNHTIATPNKLFEYIQARVPIATSRLPMIERIVGEARIGGFVDFTTPESTAAGLRRFVSETLPTVSAEAADAAARRYSWEREEEALFAVVDAAIRREPR